MINIKVDEYYSGDGGGIPCAIALVYLVLAGFIIVDLIGFSMLLAMGQLLVLILLLVLISYVLRNPPGAIPILIGAGLLIAFSIPILIDLQTRFPGTTIRIGATIVGCGLLVWGGIAALKVRKEMMPGLSTHYWPELGLELADTRNVSARKGIQLPGGVYIVRIFADSPSDMAGLKPGGVIVELENQSIRTLQDMWPIQKRIWQTIMDDLQRDRELDMCISLRIWQSDQIIPKIDDTLKKKLSESFQLSLKPTRKSLFYQIGLFLVVVAMVLLPLIYVLLIFAFGYGIYNYETVYATVQLAVAPFLSTVQNGSFRRALPLVPILILLILTIFMAIPLIAPVVKSFQYYVVRSQFLSILYQTIPIHHHPLYSLYAPEEPTLYFFVEKICKSINAPVPKRIDLTIEPNAYASFRKGIFSFFRNDDLVLTIGLPLISTLSVQQLGGIIAHELGHFSQNYGMRLSFVIHSINNWFEKVVYGDDSFIESLSNWIDSDSSFGLVIIHSVRLFIWITRKILWAFMMLGFIISHFMLRQMEFDADHYEIQVAGSKTFEANVYNIRVLDIVYYNLYAKLIATSTNSLLVNSFSDLIRNKVNNISTKTLDEIKQETLETKTKIFDAHPSDKERIINARTVNEEGLLHLDQLSDVLFSSFENLVQDVTYRFYQNEFGDEIKNIKLLPVHEYLDHYSSNRAKYQKYLRDYLPFDSKIREAFERLN